MNLHKTIFLLLALFFFQKNKANSITKDSISFFSNKLLKATSKQEQAFFNLKLGTLYLNDNIVDKSYSHLKKAVSLYELLNNKEKAIDIYYQIFELLKSQRNSDIDYTPYINRYLDYAVKKKDTSRLIIAYKAYGNINFNPKNHLKAKEYYFKSLDLAILINDKINIEKNYSNLGVLYSSPHIKKQDSARFFLNKAIKINHSYKLPLFINYANSYEKEYDYINAIKYLEKAKKQPIEKYQKEYLSFLNKKISDCYKEIDQFEKSYYAYVLHTKYKDSINVTKQNTNIAEIEEKYKVAKRDKEILELKVDSQQKEKEKLELKISLEQEQRQKKHIWMGTILTLLIGGSFAYYINKNTKRKQLLAEKDKALQIQKISTLLKEQELTSIDAMISGQEKERQRIANDLHDDLGALMATIKLHINAINTEGKKQINQIDILVNEAYNKIRGMAHSHNAGVMAKDGLLKALHKVASTINKSKQLHINVASHGLENRLENSLELSIFRIIQELITNIIKHAQATEATIHLTQHDDSLNIMVEDNGIGFNPQNISTKNGMGIHSIDKRIEHLNGTIDIESAAQQGTTVIIDIPL